MHRGVLVCFGAAAAVGAVLLPVTVAQAATSRNWHGCNRTATTFAANLAGVPAALDANPGLRRTFGDQLPSASSQPSPAPIAPTSTAMATSIAPRNTPAAPSPRRRRS